MTLWESTLLFLQASQKHTTVTRYMTETWQQTSKSISETQNQNVNEAEVKKNNNEEIWASFRHTPLQLVIWRVTEWTKIEKEHKMLTSKPGTKLLIFLAPGRVLALTQPGGPFFPHAFYISFVSVIHHKSCVQLVHLLTLHIWITLTRLPLLDRKRRPFFSLP